VLENNDPFVTMLVLRDAAATTRYHTKRTIRQQDLAAHSFGVMQIIHQVWPECRKVLMTAAMFHDLPEYVTGDIPAPVKRSCPQLATVLEEVERGTAPLYQDLDLTVAEELVLRWSDTMELCLWCHEEIMLGNMYCMDTLKRGLGWCEGIVTDQVDGIVPPHVSRAMNVLTYRLRTNIDKHPAVTTRQGD
jgi:hypothetical protein